MTAIRNARYEKLASGLADGLSQEKAYIAAGFSAKGARGAASSLLKQNSYILERRDEILSDREKMQAITTARALDSLKLSKQDLISQLWDNAMVAKAAVPVLDREGNPIGVYKANIAASNQALHLLGKELGMFGDKKNEPVNEHANKSIEELRQIVIEKSRKLGIPLPPIFAEYKKVDEK